MPATAENTRQVPTGRKRCKRCDAVRRRGHRPGAGRAKRCERCDAVRRKGHRPGAGRAKRRRRM